MKGKCCIIPTLLIIGLVTIFIVVYILPCYFGLYPRYGSDRTICNSPYNLIMSNSEAIIRFQPANSSNPIEYSYIPQHPFMASNAGNNMHNDAYMSDAYTVRGPDGVEHKVTSRTQGFGGYGTMAFDHHGRIVAVHSSGRKFQLELMDPETLEELESYDLPARPWYFLLQGIPPWKYIGAGMYFFLDNDHLAVVPTTNNTIQVVQVPRIGLDEGFSLVKEYDLREFVVQLPWPREDSVAWILPDWSGWNYWFATTEGVVGKIDLANDEIDTRRLEAEKIENSFAVGEDGIYILSDKALYRFNQSAAGMISIDWRTPYDRGPASKPGHITRGSGTSVTLMGDESGYVVITDNAEPQIHVLFIRRSDGEKVCSVPVFKEGKSGTDISLIGFEHGDRDNKGIGNYSVIVENNWGHHKFPFAFPEPGIVRVDMMVNENETKCRQIWSSGEKNIGVYKLSFGSGLLYVYFRDESVVFPKWYLTAIEFDTGNIVYKQLVGTGIGYNNWAGSIFLHPDGRRLYSTSIFGLIMVEDKMYSGPILP